MENAIGSSQQTAVSSKQEPRFHTPVFFLTAYCLLLTAGVAEAVEKKPGATPPPVAEAAPAAPPAAEVKPLSPEDQVRAQLDGTTWSVQLMPSSGAKAAKPQKDTITFTKRQVSSEFLTKAGYPNSNYSLTLGDDGRAVWETMQTKEGEGVAFWRGEVDGATMRGVLSKHPLEGEPEDYSISGQSTGEKKITVPSAAQAPGAAVQVAPAAKTAPAATIKEAHPAKKKRKLF